MNIKKGIKKISVVVIFVIITILVNNISMIVLARENDDTDAAVQPLPFKEELTLCADSAEDLGININDIKVYSVSEPYGDLSEYTLVSRHFIIDESLHTYLTTNITPDKFNLFMERMDIAYEAMAELISNEPCYGAKIRIQHGGEGSYGYQWTYIGRPDIYWNGEYIENILQNISGNIDDWWFAGTLHELGHVFDDSGDWKYDSEGSATYKAWMVIMKCNNEIHYNNQIYDCDSFIDYIETQSNEGVGTVFNPILNRYGFEYGWNILNKVYGSYFDPYYPRTFYKSEENNNNDCLFVDFVNRCSWFLGSDIKELWSSETKQQNNIRMSSVTIDNDNIRVVLFPRKARIGDELTYSVYNVKTTTKSDVRLQRGGSWYNEHKNKSIELRVGNNYNIPLGYALNYDTAGNGLIIWVANCFSNWINTSTVSGRYDGLQLSNENLLVGDVVDVGVTYQWQVSTDGLIWEDIPYATQRNYIATGSEWNKFIRCKMTDQKGVVYISQTSNEIALFSANLLDAKNGLYPKLTFNFHQKPEILNTSTMNVKIYINKECVEVIEVQPSDQPIGWILSKRALNVNDIGKEMYAEVYYKSNTGYIGKIKTPTVIIQ